MSVFIHPSLHSLSLSHSSLLRTFFEIFPYSFIIIQSLSSARLCGGWAWGARPRGNLLYGQTWLETPDPVRSPKLSNHGRVQYSGGGPPGKRTYCTACSTSVLNKGRETSWFFKKSLCSFSPSVFLGQRWAGCTISLQFIPPLYPQKAFNFPFVYLGIIFPSIHANFPSIYPTT